MKKQLRIRRIRRSGFEPDSEYVAKSTEAYLKAGGHIERLPALSDKVSKFHHLENDFDFTKGGIYDI